MENQAPSKKNLTLIIVIIVIIVLGLITYWFVQKGKVTAPTTPPVPTVPTTPETPLTPPEPVPTPTQP